MSPALIAIRADGALRAQGYPEDIATSLSILASLPGAELDQAGTLRVAQHQLSLIDAHQLQITAPAGTATVHQIGFLPSPHQMEAETRLQAILRDRPLCVAASFGKDSTVVVALALNAADQLRRAGITPHPLIVTTADTGVENPEVVAIRETMIRGIEAFAETTGLDIRIVVTRPRLSERFWPRILAGRKLPSSPGSNGDCTVDMKIKPQQRARRAIELEVLERGLPLPVTAVGTRFDESARRSAHMAERGEGVEIADGVIAPIADWSTVQVFEFLADPRAPKPPLPFHDVLQFYADAGAGECGFTPESKVGKHQACGARSGCYTCQMVGDDRSASALVEAGHDYLAPLLALNRYLRAIRHDYTRRHWIGKQLDPITGYARWQPNCFSFETTDALMRILLTLDVQEAERAAAVGRALAAGDIQDTPRNRRLATPQFRNLQFDDILAIDFWRSVDGHGPEHAALRAWQDVVVEGQRYPVPDIHPPAASAPLPAPRFMPLPALGEHEGLAHPVEALAGVGLSVTEHPLTGEIIQRHPSQVDDRHFEIDLEAAVLFEQFEMPRALDEAPEMGPTGAARRYLNLGLAPIPSGGLSSLDHQLSRTLTLARAGLARAEISAAQSISEEEHDQLRQQLAVAAGLPVSVVRTPAQRRALDDGWAQHHAFPVEADIDPNYLWGRKTGLEMALAAGVQRFEGHDLATLLDQCNRLLRRIGQPHAAILNDVRKAAMRLVAGEDVDGLCSEAPLRGLFPYAFLSGAPAVSRQTLFPF